LPARTKIIAIPAFIVQYRSLADTASILKMQRLRGGLENDHSQSASDNDSLPAHGFIAHGFDLRVFYDVSKEKWAGSGIRCRAAKG
jgi:hypothetical protein